jgi:hypothetical protein
VIACNSSSLASRPSEESRFAAINSIDGSGTFQVGPDPARLSFRLYPSLFPVHFPLASSFISCHNWSTARRRRAVNDFGRPFALHDLVFAPAQSHPWHRTEPLAHAQLAYVGGSRHL